MANALNSEKVSHATCFIAPIVSFNLSLCKLVSTGTSWTCLTWQCGQPKTCGGHNQLILLLDVYVGL